MEPAFKDLPFSHHRMGPDQRYDNGKVMWSNIWILFLLSFLVDEWLNDKGNPPQKKERTELRGTPRSPSQGDEVTSFMGIRTIYSSTPFLKDLWKKVSVAEDVTKQLNARLFEINFSACTLRNHRNPVRNPHAHVNIRKQSSTFHFSRCCKKRRHWHLLTTV